MIQSRKTTQSICFLGTLLLTLALSACASKEQKAIDQAKAQAAKTGQAQQVVTVDKTGTTTTTVVQPPAQGQKAQAVSTISTPAAAGAPVPQASGPTISAVAPPAPPPVEPAKISIPSGTVLAIRVDQRISVKHGHAGESFTGEIVDPISGSDGGVLVPKGAPVDGRIVKAHRRGHFKGASELELRLTSLTLNGTQYPIATKDLARTRKGKGKRSTAMIGGGAGLGMLVGGVATGGVGLLVGGLVGGGGGAVAAGATGNRDIDTPAESIVHFTLADDLVLDVPQQQ